MLNKLRSLSFPRPRKSLRTDNTSAYCETLEFRLCPSGAYVNQIVAQSGHNGVTSISAGASVNDQGTVAFVGQVGSGQGIFVAAGATVTNITPGFNSASRVFGPSVDINDQGQVGAVDRTSLSGQIGWEARLWNSNSTNSFNILGRGFTPVIGSSFDAIASSVSLNKNNQLAFESLVGSQWDLYLTSSLVTSTSPPLNSVGTPQFLRPVAADNGSVVLQTVDPSTQKKTIQVFGGNVPGVIASTSVGFSDLGAAPGISADGQIVTFYGVVAASGPLTSQLGAGPGIFASIETASGRVLTRVAGTSVVSGGFSSFSTMTPVAVDSTLSTLGYDTIVYLATDARGQGIYTVRLHVAPGTNKVTVDQPEKVISVGDPLGPGGPVITALSITAPISENGQIVYWATTASGQAVVKAIPAVSIDETTVVPANAGTTSPLALNHVWGTESLTIPVTVNDPGAIATNGSMVIDVYLSTTPNVSGNPVFSKTFTNVINAPPAHDIFNVTIPSLSTTLTVGRKYYIVVQARQTGTPNGSGFNAVTADPFEYFSTGPSNNLNINGGKTYYKIVADDLANVNPFALQGVSIPADGKHFTAAFESPGGYDHPNLAPYLDGKPGDTVRHPTIGIGINLDSISASLLTVLAADVRVTRPGLKLLTDSQILVRLKADASSPTPPNSLTVLQAQHLLDQAYSVATTAAKAFVGATAWQNLLTATPHATWVLIDLAFNAGGGGGISGFTQFQEALTGNTPDYIRAGFELLDSKRSATQVQYARSLADYEYLVGSTPLVFKRQ